MDKKLAKIDFPRRHVALIHLYYNSGSLSVRSSVRLSTFSSTPSHGPISNLSPFLESSHQVGGNKIIWGPIGA